MGQTAFPYQAVRGLPAQTLAARNAATAGPLGTVSWSTASAGDVLTVQGDGTVAFAAVSAGIGGSTGSVDNAILRADGTGGATLQACDWIIADNYTSSPNATVNHASIQATGGTTNVSVSIVPKGSGAFSLRVPDGTATGGNARGANAVDLSTLRSTAAQVASGSLSINIGVRNTASAQGSISIGDGNTNSSAENGLALGFQNSATAVYWAVAIGARNTVSGSGEGNVAIGGYNLSSSNDINFPSCAIGRSNTASAGASVAFGSNATATRHGQQSHAAGRFAANGDVQQVQFVLRNTTTTNSAVTLFLDGSSARLTIPSGKILHATVHILGSKSDGTAVASYMRQVTIKNVGGTTSLVGTVNTLGTDEAASTSIAITADDTNDALQINVTGITSETWRWVAVVYGVELAYGT